MTEIDRGKFVVVYGINGVGKSEQVKRLATNMSRCFGVVQTLKYPIEKNSSTFPAINAVLREGLFLDDYEFQKLYAINRFDFQPTLETMLGEGIQVVAEDYMGTGLAWGTAKGVPLEVLEEMNNGLIIPNLSILLDGVPYSSAKEIGHRHESDNSLLMVAKEKHLFLAEKYGWKVVDANQDMDKVEKDIWNNVKENL